MNTVFALVKRSCLFVLFTLAPTVLFALGAVPTIYSFSPASGTNGTIVSIQGVNFASFPSNNIVYFGAVRATVLSAGLSNLTVRVPVGATYAPITVLANDLIGYSGKPFEPTFTGNGGAFDAMSFAAPLTFAMPSGPQQVAIGDLDGDGKPDLVVNNVYAHNISIFRNISSGGVLSSNSFATRVDLPALYPADNTDNPYGVTLADVDRDGKLDIVTFDQDNNKIIVYKNISSPGTLDANSFAPPVYFDSAPTPRSVVVADIDGDGRPDIVYSAAGAGAVSVLQNIGTAGVINSNSFAPHVEFAAGAVPVNTAVGDLDGDGRLDVVAANYNGNTISVLRNISLPGTINSNSFAPAINLPTPSGAAAIALGDIDGDGKIDLVVGSVGHTLSLFQNLATAGSISSNSFGARVDFPTPGIPHTIALGDLNGDGKADIALVSELNSALSIWENVSTLGPLTTNSLAPRVDYTTGYNAWGVAVGDLDGDGRPDIAFGNAYDATMWVYQNTSAFAGSTSSNTAPVITSQPTNQMVAAGSTAQFSVTATGSPTLNYQWFVRSGWNPGGMQVFGATNSTLIISNVQPNNLGAYFVVVSNLFGSATSSNASLTLIGTISNLPPVITKQPTNQTVSAGGTVMFSVMAGGSPTLDYQWYHNGALIPGAVSYAYGIASVQPKDAGSYFVIVTNLYGSAVSSNATLTVIGGTNSGSCTPPPPGIVAWWRAENNASDSVGTNNGTINGGVGFSPGEVGQAFDFAGTNGYISVPASSNLDVGQSGGMTIEGWIKPDHLGPIGAEGRPIVEYDTLSAIGVHFFFESGYTLYANIVDTSNASHPVQSAPGTIVTNALQHVAVTYDKASGNCFLYINGTQVASANFGNITPQTSYPLSIGLRAANGFPGSGSFYNGLLDELSIYNRALSPAEIQAIYNAGSEGKCTSTTTSNLPPVITHQPTNQTVAVGGTARFSVTATGSPPLQYQWYYTTLPPSPTFPAIHILGATNSTLIRSNVQPNEAGYYFAVVRNAYGLAVSSNAVLTVIGGTNGDSCTPPPSGLVGWWPGEGNADDVIGGDNGTLEGGATFAAGKVGDGFRFDGTNGYVQIPDSAALKPTNVTVEAWVWLDPNLPANHGGEHIVFKKNTWSAWFEGYSLLKETIDNGDGTFSDHFQFCVSRNGDQVAINSKTIVQRGIWYHVAATYDGNQSILYVNGVAEASATPGFALDYDTTPIFIGTTGTWAPYLDMFGGIIDEVSIYNRALTAGEIQAIYNAGSNGKCSSTSANIAPVITQQPVSQGVPVGGTAQFSVTATGSPTLYYQWYFRPAFGWVPSIGAPVPRATNSTLTVSNVQTSSSGFYQVVVSNLFGSATSSNAMLTVGRIIIPPEIYLQPTNQTVSVGGTAQFRVEATGSPILYYQWFFKPLSIGSLATPIPGATGPLLTVSNAQPSNAGDYFAVIDNLYGSVTSSNALLTVTNGVGQTNLPTALLQVANTSASSGTSFDVPIILVAKGNENAMSFSLSFDAHTLTYSNTVLGTNAASGLILLNASQASNGVLGVELALPSGQTFAPGTQQVARVTFSTPLFTGPEPLVTPINFTDQPIARLLSDAQSHSLDAAFSNGIVTISPAGFEADVSPRPSGDGKVNLFDWVQVGRFVAGLDTISNASEFQRVDCAPRSTLGDGQIKVTDWVQAGRYAAGLDPLTPAGGPTGPISSNVPLAIARAATSRQVTISSRSTVKGLTTTMPITLQAQGDESALAFSLSFDPTVLKYVSTANGSAATSATLVVNANQAASGKLAIVLCLPNGSYFPDGLDEIAKVTFVAVGTGTNSTVNFADQPVFRSISDTNAAELTASYVANSILVNPHPIVSAVPVGRNSVFSWPVWAGDFTLQAASNLTPPVHWTNVPVTLQTNGNNIQVTIPAPNGGTFYRLYHP